MTIETGQPIRWGIIGTGGIAKTFAGDLALLPDAALVAVGSRSQSSADTFGDRFGIARRHASYEDLATDPDVDAVYVATPHPMHHDSAMLAIGLDQVKFRLISRSPSPAARMSSSETRTLVNRMVTF